MLEPCILFTPRIYHPRLDPTDSHVLGNLGMLLYEMEDLEGAEETLRECLEHSPDDTPSLCNLGSFLCDTKHDYHAAQQLFEKVIKTRMRHSAC